MKIYLIIPQLVLIILSSCSNFNPKEQLDELATTIDPNKSKSIKVCQNTQIKLLSILSTDDVGIETLDVIQAGLSLDATYGDYANAKAIENLDKTYSWKSTKVKEGYLVSFTDEGDLGGFWLVKPEVGIVAYINNSKKLRDKYLK